MSENTPPPMKKSTRKKKTSSPSNTNTNMQSVDIASVAKPIESDNVEPVLSPSETTPIPKKKSTKRSAKKSTSATHPSEDMIVESGSIGLSKKSTRKPKKSSIKPPIQSVTTSDSILLPKETPKNDIPIIENSKPVANIQKEVPPIEEVPLPKQESQIISTKDTEATLLDRIPSVPSYLMSRMSKDAQKFFVMGLLELNRLPADKLEKAIEHLTGSRMFFDAQYANEKDIIMFIDKKMALMNKRLEELREAEAQEKIHKLFIEPLMKGKFDKFVKQLGSGYSVEACAADILDKMGRDARKIPLSEYALRRKFEEILREKFKDKLPK